MLEPKNTLVGLAGQKAWHIWTGVAPPRSSGKYLPSQLRTQNAGPELATVGLGGCWWLPEGSPKKFVSGAAALPRSLARPSTKKSNRFPAETGGGASAMRPEITRS